MRRVLITPLEQQGSHKPERLDFGTQTRQVRLFFSQHFVDILHTRQAPVIGLTKFRAGPKAENLLRSSGWSSQIVIHNRFTQLLLLL
jgi:hypothetical protein